MISENISQDTKVWTKEYDLDNNLIKIWGERDKDGNFIYDNLDDYKYVDVEYDTYKYVRKTPSAAAQKLNVVEKFVDLFNLKEKKKVLCLPYCANC